MNTKKPMFYTTGQTADIAVQEVNYDLMSYIDGEMTIKEPREEGTYIQRDEQCEYEYKTIKVIVDYHNGQPPSEELLAYRPDTISMAYDEPTIGNHCW